MVISDESIRLKMGEVAIISVKMRIPRNHIIIPHGRTFNPVGCVLKVGHESLYPVECERVIHSYTQRDILRSSGFSCEKRRFA
ncbi:hypothetical protein DRN72_05000 [Methanosarcinales archaeon]|nr:MAG: hypothetical protein DRN72_05000 [Methanosarcinales archaeon]